jgi:hypothetical protein
VVSTLLIDMLVLVTITGRISEWGTTPNKTMALGLNIVLLVNLAWAAKLAIDFARRRVPFAAVERWQTNYLPVFALWASAVVLAFPPLFDYL